MVAPTSIHFPPELLTPEYLDNLPPNVKYEVAKLHRRRDSAWTSEAKKRFTAEYYRYRIIQGLTLTEMAKKLGRSYQGVRSDVRRYGLLEFFAGIEHVPKSTLEDPRFIPPHVILAMSPKQQQTKKAEDSRTLYRQAQDEAKIKLKEHQIILDKLIEAVNNEIDAVARGEGDVGKVARLQSALASQQKTCDQARDSVLELSLLGERLAI